MHLSLALVLLGALVLAATAAGLVWRLRDGRRRGPSDRDARVAPSELDGPLGDRGTLVQFGTEFCARCPQVRRMLRDLVSGAHGVAHREIDLTHRTDLAARHRIRTTPTTFLVDGHGTVRARFVGVPARSDVLRALDELPALQEAR